ncbi:hypothetical protein DRW07_02045 [Alteromonas sediminis]|uniref:Uncharacterized protein n=1 Tax=Alteromonas sediminis TaxID=2259342 RepID=A0A3N5Y305_9ALTE|nr:hypothetical protein [Alteromonas sediminis]RPJ68212.1 hypothetical protein DRW07_02045 [Alteromonas sediminis]
MKHEFTLAGFLGIPPRQDDNNTFEATDSNVEQDDSSPTSTSINPTTGLPLITPNASIDVMGNAIGQPNTPEIEEITTSESSSACDNDIFGSSIDPFNDIHDTSGSDSFMDTWFDALSDDW